VVQLELGCGWGRTRQSAYCTAMTRTPVSSVTPSCRQAVAIFYTRGKHALVLGSSAPECFIFRDPFYTLVLFSSDFHSPDITPAYDRLSTDQACSAILSLYSRALAVASSLAYHNTGINFQDGRRSDCKRLF
jgi:hypothetical protein